MKTVASTLTKHLRHISRRAQAHYLAGGAGTLWLLIGILFLGQTGHAQIIFSVTNLPSRIGVDYQRAYLNTADSDVSALLGQPGAARRWDFSQPRAAGEVIQRTDIVAPADGGQGSGFPAATFAERDSNESNGQQNWSYYRLSPHAGRVYYGFYDANSNPTCPRKVFNQPTVDLLDDLSYGQTWSRAVDFADCLDLGGAFFQLSVHFTASGTVDAWGTVVLPEIGEVPALRVNEVNTWEVSLSGLSISTQSYRNYHWLVRGIGRAVTIISEGSSSAPPANFPTAKTVLRVFEASEVTDRPTSRPVQNLRIHLDGATAILDWQAETNTPGYLVQTATNLPATNWQSLAEPLANTWSNAVSFTEPQRYYRVLAKP